MDAKQGLRDIELGNITTFAHSSIDEPGAVLADSEEPLSESVGNAVDPIPQRSSLAWHPKLTFSRLFVITSTLGLGTAKATALYRGEAVVSVTIEWILSIVLFLIFLIFSSIESNADAKPQWLFQYDALGLVWHIARKLSFHPPLYKSDERTTDLLIKPQHPPVTIYRLLVTSLVVGFGILKAVLSYMGRATEPVTVEWLFGTFLSVGLYYLGLYEQSSPPVLPALFEEDYINELMSTATSLTWIVIYTMGLVAAGVWTYVWSSQGYSLWFAEGSSAEDRNSPPTAGSVDDFLMRVYSALFLPFVILVPVAFGLGGSFVIVGRLGRLTGPPVVTLVCRLGSFVKKCVGLRDSDLPLAWQFSNMGWRGVIRTSETLVSFVISGKPFIFIIYIGAHFLALALSLGWTALCAMMLPGVWRSFEWLPWSAWVPFAGLLLTLAVFMVAGVVASLYVVVAFFSIFARRRHLLVESWAF